MLSIKYVVISELKICIDYSKWGSVTKNGDNYKNACHKLKCTSFPYSTCLWLSFDMQHASIQSL